LRQNAIKQGYCSPSELNLYSSAHYEA
jgi:hypothetical protein